MLPALWLQNVLQKRGKRGKELSPTEALPLLFWRGSLPQGVIPVLSYRQCAWLALGRTIKIAFEGFYMRMAKETKAVNMVICYFG